MNRPRGKREEELDRLDHVAAARDRRRPTLSGAAGRGPRGTQPAPARRTRPRPRPVPAPRSSSKRSALVGLDQVARSRSPRPRARGGCSRARGRRTVPSPSSMRACARGSGLSRARLAAEDVALDPVQQSPRARDARVERIDEAVVVVEAGDRVERAHVLAPRPTPESERRRVAGVRVLPEPLARAERVDDDVRGPSHALEELEEAAGHVGEAEDVHGAGQRRGLRLERGDRLVEQDERRGPRAPLPREAALSEHREPQSALPGFDLREAVGQRRQALALAATRRACRRANRCTPRRAARVAPRAGRGARPSGRWRRPRRGGTPARGRARRARATRRPVGPEAPWPRSRRRRRGVPRDPPDDLGREAREPREVEVRRDALLARDPEAKVPLDVRARRHDAHRREGPVAHLLRANPRRKLGEQLLRAVRIDEADHERGIERRLTLARRSARGKRAGAVATWRACRSGLFV